MMNDRQEITLGYDGISTVYCAFNLKGELILCNAVSDDDDDDWNNVVNTVKIIITINSIQKKNNKLMYKCKKVYWLPRETRNVNISKYDENYLFSDNSIYNFNLITEEKIKIFGVDEETIYNDFEKVIKVFSKTI